MELLREVQPTTFCGIPWVWDRMLDSLKTKHLDSTAFRRRIDRWAMRMGLSTNKRRMMGCGRRWTGAQGAGQMGPGGSGHMFCFFHGSASKGRSTSHCASAWPRD